MTDIKDYKCDIDCFIRQDNFAMAMGLESLVSYKAMLHVYREYKKTGIDIVNINIVFPKKIPLGLVLLLFEYDKKIINSNNIQFSVQYSCDIIPFKNL